MEGIELNFTFFLCFLIDDAIIPGGRIPETHKATTAYLVSLRAPWLVLLERPQGLLYRALLTLMLLFKVAVVGFLRCLHRHGVEAGEVPSF